MLQTFTPQLGKCFVAKVHVGRTCPYADPSASGVRSRPDSTDVFAHFHLLFCADVTWFGTLKLDFGAERKLSEGEFLCLGVNLGYWVCLFACLFVSTFCFHFLNFIYLKSDFSLQLCVQNSPQEARNMLLQNPQLAYALLQAQVVMRIVDPEIALVRIKRLVKNKRSKSFIDFNIYN